MALIADVFDVILIDTDGDVVATTTLQKADIAVTVSENEVRGGKGNALIGLLHVSRDIAINLTDAEFKYAWLAKQLGQNIVTGAGVGYAMPKFYTVDVGLKITLDETPVDEVGMVIYDNTGKLIADTAYSVTTKDVTFTTGAVEGDVVEVRTYRYATAATTETIEIDSSIFAKGVKAILETLEIDGDENPTHKLQYQFDSAVPTGNFNINTASEKQAATQDFGLKVIKPKTSTVVGRVLRTPIV